MAVLLDSRTVVATESRATTTAFRALRAQLQARLTKHLSSRIQLPGDDAIQIWVHATVVSRH